LKKGLNLILPEQIQLVMGSGNKVGIAFGFQLAKKSRTDQPPVTGDVDF